jgi:iron complex transport system ATP-binding protein
LSAGVLNAGDSDEITALGLGIATVKEKPFASITSENDSRNRELIEQADLVVVAAVYWGEGNLKNLDAVQQAAGKGKKTVMVEMRVDYDFTRDKKATRIMQGLKALPNVTVAGSEGGALKLVQAIPDQADDKSSITNGGTGGLR